MTHPDFGEQEFMVASRMFTVVMEGEMPFVDELPPPVAEVVNEPVLAPDTPAMPNNHLLWTPPPGRGLLVKEIAELQAQGFTVNVGNEPVKENEGPVGPVPMGMWMHPTFCPRQSNGHTRVRGKWVGIPWPNVAEMDKLELFLLCFPITYLKDTIIQQMSKQ